MAKWCSKLLSACENTLSNVVISQSDRQNTYDEDQLINLLYVVGEAAQRCDKIPKRLSLSVQALLTHTSVTGGCYNKETICDMLSYSSLELDLFQ